MKYIEKILEDRFGHENSFWRVTNINIKLNPIMDYSNPENPVQTGEQFGAIIELKGWKDLQAYQAGKPEADKRTIYIERCGDLTNFQAIYDEISQKILQDSQFVNGQILETT